MLACLTPQSQDLCWDVYVAAYLDKRHSPPHESSQAGVDVAGGVSRLPPGNAWTYGAADDISRQFHRRGQGVHESREFDEVVLWEAQWRFRKIHGVSVYLAWAVHRHRTVVVVR